VSEKAAGRYDHAARRRSQRRGRERGCSVYIPEDELRKAGFDPADPPPYFRVWGSPRGSVLVRFYREP
jgi:hypothetical protein